MTLESIVKERHGNRYFRHMRSFRASTTELFGCAAYARTYQVLHPTAECLDRPKKS